MIRLTGTEAEAWAEVMRRVCSERKWLWRDPYALKWAINVFGIRSMSSKAGVYDDEAMVVYGHPEEGVVVDRYCITTDPGPYFLKRPIHPRGAAILAHGHQYFYKVGWHKAGKAPGYQACNQLGRVLVYRDDDRDDVLEYKVDSIMVGSFGINHHHGGEDSKPGDTFQGKSAGCQVWASRSEFEGEYLPCCIRSEQEHGRGFPYAVLLQAEVEAAQAAYLQEQKIKATEAVGFVWEFFE